MMSAQRGSCGAGGYPARRLLIRANWRFFNPPQVGNLPHRDGRRGQALVQFAMSALLALLLILSVIEFSRIMLVYTSLADAARLGVRYAITHGTIPGNSANVAAMQSSVQSVVQKFLAPATVNISTVTITTSFPNISTSPCSSSASPSTCGTLPGNPVQVNISYPYNLLIAHLAIHPITLSTTSEGIITW